MAKNIGVFNGNWKGGERPEFDTPLPQLTELDILQARIDAANCIIFLGDLPESIALAKQMEAKARAEVLKIAGLA